MQLTGLMLGSTLTAAKQLQWEDSAPQEEGLEFQKSRSDRTPRRDRDGDYWYFIITEVVLGMVVSWYFSIPKVVLGKTTVKTHLLSDTRNVK